ncbi:MAG: carbamoyltransferase HypF, partial [Xanthomonadales bacterium]|nr:carbamoyltransferase HypF [Xanthomonadales bacterium]
LTGRVQGVGFRPFVYNKAVELGLAGSVYNGSGKVFIHAEGPGDALDRFAQKLLDAAPPLARPQLASCTEVEPRGLDAFTIETSDSGGEAEIHVPPDLFTCDDCLAELSDPGERRHGYAFINCTQCGPRYTIITAMPYDRPNTSMADFPLCADCAAEYGNPADRRFHAQPLACAVCGPKLEFVAAAETAAGSPLGKAVAALEAGRIVAIKGVGGYHLACDARNEKAVAVLRKRKRRPDKPLAVMFPLRGDDGLDAVREHIDLDNVSAAALLDPARPIVLAPVKCDQLPASSRTPDQVRGDASGQYTSSSRNLPAGKYPGSSSRASLLAPGLAPGLRELGVFLPYSPLHHELLNRFGGPLVATSGNISGEPVITVNDEAQQRLGAIADAFLHHDRPIVRPADDPVVRPMAGRSRIIRPGRGLAPIERQLPARLAAPLLATGGHMKNTVALAWDDRVVVSPHIGDLDSPRSNDVFNQVINELQKLYDVSYDFIACDLHPGYASTRWAQGQGLPVLQVQHHAAHASALAGEHPGVERWLVFTWDGVGYGDDGTLWGGEALAGNPGAWQRVSSFRPFRLVGGDRAGREPWRSAAALLWDDGREYFVSEQISSAALQLAHDGWQRNINSFTSSAAGRLFDAAAALVLGRESASFEGQGPMELEQAAQRGCSALKLPLALDEHGLLRADWSPLLPMLRDEEREPAERAGVFHETMAQSLVDQALEIRQRTPFDAVGLSGGVFQNRLLTERAVQLLKAADMDVRLHEHIPANDGGLCFGQVIEALRKCHPGLDPGSSAGVL